MSTPQFLLTQLEDRMAEVGLHAHDLDVAEAGIRALLRLMGEDPNRSGLTATPTRVVNAFLEMTDKPGEPADLLATMFDDAGPVDEMIVVGPIPFTSICEHHLLPFTGHAHIGYIPNGGGVIGLSKLPRLLEHFARRPQVQERLTSQITTAITEHVPCQGAACVIRAVHSCAEMRGVRKPAPMKTSSLSGVFRDDATARSEFFDLTRD